MFSLFSFWLTIGLVGLWVLCAFKLVKNIAKIVNKGFDAGRFVKIWFLIGALLYIPYLFFGPFFQKDVFIKISRAQSESDNNESEFFIRGKVNTKSVPNFFQAFTSSSVHVEEVSSSK